MRTAAILSIILFLFMATEAHAQAAHGFEFCWDDPVERIDSEPLDPETELAGYTLQVALRDGFANGPLVSVYVSRADTEPQSADGRHRCYFWEDAVQQGGWYDARMSALDVNELESEWSDIKTVRKIAIPRPPRQR